MQLAEALVVIHAVDGRATKRIPGYRTYIDLTSAAPPRWSRRPQLWERALELASAQPPPGPRCLIHRDYHPENTLRSRGRLSGIVDWTSGSWGPAAVDIGHMRWNLAVAYGLDAAPRRFCGSIARSHPWSLRTSTTGISSPCSTSSATSTHMISLRASTWHGSSATRGTRSPGHPDELRTSAQAPPPRLRFAWRAAGGPRCGCGAGAPAAIVARSATRSRSTGRHRSRGGLEIRPQGRPARSEAVESRCCPGARRQPDGRPRFRASPRVR